MATWDEVFGDNAPEIPSRMLDIFRRWIDDERTSNRLLGGIPELTDENLEDGLRLALDDWNSTTPITTYVFTDHPSVVLLFTAGLIYAFNTVGMRHTRNQLTYSDGGISVAINDKTTLVQSWISQKQAEYEPKKRQLKNQINAEGGYGSISSEYSEVSFGRGYWT